MVMVHSSVPVAVVLAVSPAELAQTEAGEGVMSGVAGLSLMVTLVLLVAEQFDPLVTCSEIPTVPDVPAV